MPDFKMDFSDRKGSCELKGCMSGEHGTVPVIDNIGDGSWLVWICKDCAKKLGLKQFDDLPR